MEWIPVKLYNWKSRIFLNCLRYNNAAGSHLQLINQPEKTIEKHLIRLANSEAPIEAEKLAPLLSVLKRVQRNAGDELFRIGEKNDLEYFVVGGLLRTYVVNSEGGDVTLGFYDAPTVLSPSITRCHGGLSTVICEALENSVVYEFPFAALLDLMSTDSAMHRWGNAVLRNDLLRRSQRELSLVSMNGSERLQDFRNRFNDLESRISHPPIASYLGMTPVSLSRLRNTR